MTDNNNKNNKQTNKNPFDKVKDKFSKGGKKPKGGFNFYWIYGIIAVVFIGLQLINFGGSTKETTRQEFEQKMLRSRDVEKIVIVNNELIAEIYIKPEVLESKEQYKNVKTKSLGNSPNKGPHYYLPIGSVDSFESQVKEAQSDYADNEKVSVIYDHRKSWGGEALGWILPIALMIGLWIFIMRRMSGGGGPGGQIFNFGKSKATLFDQDTNINITFEDVAGLEGAKIEIKEIVEFLKHPKKFTTLGAKIPKGALLVGPPGTGKTLLAKAVAGEAKVPFFSLSGSDFVEMFVGVGASRVRDLFKQAKEKAPCIIFIDEIDAIGRARGKNPMQGANDERENTLNQLLTEMDGFGTNSGIIVLAATNRADILDGALMRAGRFDRQIHVEMPDVNERKEIFQVHLKPLKLDDSVNVDFLAKQTPGFSGADIANLCNESALIAARKDKEAIGKQDFLDAVDRIVGGLEKKNKIISPLEKKVIAYHEAGHATISWLLEHASPLVKVTIVPRGKSLGAAWYLPEERQITTTEQLFDEMCAALGGRAAEEITFGKISTGALSDLEKITKQAYAMTAIYGLNDKLGNISYYDSTGSEYSFTKPYSEKTAQLIDEEVSKLIERAYDTTKKILLNNKEKLSLLANALLSKEVIFKEDLQEIFGKRPFDKDEDIVISIPSKVEEKAGEKNEDAKNDEQNSVPMETPPLSASDKKFN
ncbi:MAG: ATP-dependent metallopeptidase FtsH/Yme1/Tma family protein [Bacteroidetes bacterium]|nr:ATP-dependent metallopeptidase FtsH/Yme1/Tma family protein [Bacteroidota bacterium]HET6243996.1 ATP-dependent zinc metalloprotease FtsH [Bacteroidia bacterium]